MPLTRQHSSQLQVLPLPTGDEILELNGESMSGLTHQDALQKFKVISCYQNVGPGLGITLFHSVVQIQTG